MRVAKVGVQQTVTVQRLHTAGVSAASRVCRLGEVHSEYT